MELLPSAPSPDFQELEESLASEKKKHALTWARIKRLEGEADLLRKELIQEKLARILAEKEVGDLSVHHALQEKKIHQEALLEGAKLCLSHLFVSEMRQAFLHSLRLSLQEIYLQHSSFLGDMGPHIRHFYEYGFDTAMTQHFDPSFTGAYDKEGPLSSLPAPPAFRGDPTRPIEEAWWLSVFKRTISTLLKSDLTLASLDPMEEPLYLTIIDQPISKEEACITQALEGDTAGNDVEDPPPSSPI